MTDDLKSHALQLLTRRIGPIPKVIVKRAAEKSGGDKARFVQHLLDAAADADRSGLQRELG